MCIRKQPKMNEAQRKVLRTHHGDILKNLILDTDILGFLLQKDILSETMVQNIQAKPTQHEKIVELLFILPKRGPRAFPVFLDAVKKQSSFLADKLEVDYEKEQKLMIQQQKEQEAENQVKLDTSQSEDAANTSQGSPKSKSLSASFDHSPPKLRPEVHKRRFSVSSTNHVMTSNIIQQNLNNLYTKLKTRIESKNMREPSFNTPEPATFKMVDKLLDEVFNSLDEFETAFSQCQALLGGKDRNYPLTSHILNLQKSKRELEQDLKAKEQQKNKYGDHISKLENRCRNQTTEVNHLNEEIKKLKEENAKLEEINSEREEKQKIIDDLRKMVMDADTSKKSKLRSSYLALHYDSNVSDIKQLRAEVRNLKMENQSLKTDNLMLKKSDNLKKLVKLREDANPIKSDNGNGNHNDEDVRTKSKVPPYSQNVYSRGGPSRRTTDMDKPVGNLFAGKPFTRSSMDNQGGYENDDKMKMAAKQRAGADHPELDFKFSNSQNGSLGLKRSPSKERSNKRVTFSGDHSEGNLHEGQDNVVQIPTAHAEANMTHAQQVSATNNESNSGSPSKGTKRGRQSRLINSKSKGAAKRSASLNNLSGNREIIKMSSQLIQKSRNLRNT